MADFDLDALQEARERMRWAARDLRDTRKAYGTHPLMRARSAWSEQTRVPRQMLYIAVFFGCMGWSFIGYSWTSLWNVVAAFLVFACWALISQCERTPVSFLTEMERLHEQQVALEEAVSRYLKAHERTYMETGVFDEFDDPLEDDEKRR